MKNLYLCSGEMAERSNAAVLKTVDGKLSRGSNPFLCAKMTVQNSCAVFYYQLQKNKATEKSVA